MVDLTSKLLLGIIALALWVNVAIQFRPLATIAENARELGYLSLLGDIAQRIESLETGQCRNSKLC